MKDETYQITINGEEKNKNEIIYNNIIGNMEKQKIPKEEQIDYLKSKIAYLENTNHNKIVIGLFLFLGILTFSFGIFLLFVNLQILGVIFLIAGFAVTVIKLLTVIHKQEQVQTTKYSEVERLKRILNAKLK